ncbi:hypothetical protein [Lentzea terrae]|uniref:hypothetical protein n=1 Tax=Lentzea terrae TaxID=2200761 RepID=UPI0013007FA1|nr:hypothetical protein [Lentzea terrae]
MPLSRRNYPDIAHLGVLPDLLSKGHFLALAADFARQLYGEDLTDEQLQGLFAARLDTLAAPAAKLVPSSVPKRLPRHTP